MEGISGHRNYCNEKPPARTCIFIIIQLLSYDMSRERRGCAVTFVPKDYLTKFRLTLNLGYIL